MDDIRRRMQEIIALQQAVMGHQLDRIKEIAVVVSDSLSAGHTLYIVGDVENLLTAQHLAGLFVGQREIDRKPLPVIAFPHDASLLAVVGNDYGSGDIVDRQVQAFVQKGDVVLALSTAGKEPRVVRAVSKAAERGANTVAISGQPGNPLSANAALSLIIPSRDYQRVHECITVLGHILYSAVETMLFVTDQISTTKSLIRFACPTCGEKIFSEERFMGRKGSCPSCHAAIVVPERKAERVNVNVMNASGTGAEQRMHMRFSVQDCMVRYSKKSFFEQDPDSLPGYPMENLSQGGLGFTMHLTPGPGGVIPEPDLSLGDEIWLSIDVPAFIEPINAKGVVRRAQAMKEQAALKVGIEFVECREVEREKLRKLADNVVLRSIRRSSGLF